MRDGNEIEMVMHKNETAQKEGKEIPNGKLDEDKVTLNEVKGTKNMLQLKFKNTVFMLDIDRNFQDLILGC